jgi:ABC-type spermidine/putrescine transport system permease subunit II
MNGKIAGTVFRGWLFLVMVVLALPPVSMIALSFNESRFGTLPFEFSTRWYSELAEDAPLLESLETSMNLSVQVTLVTVLIGTLLSAGLARAHIGVRLPFNALLLAMLTVPAVIFSAGILSVLNWLGLGQSGISLVLASVVTSLPFVTLLVTGRLQGLDPGFAEAARSLGAGPVRTFLTITAPLIAPAIAAGGLLAFVITFNNFAIQLFIAPIGVSTLPVQIYSMVRLGVTPDVNALGALIVVSTVVLIVALNLLTGSAARLLAGKERTN